MNASIRKLWVLMAAVFADMIGFAMVLPLVPFYAKRFGAEDQVVGPLIAAFALTQLATAPFWGRLSDHFGRRPVILSGLTLSAAAFFLFGLADSLWLLLASRLVQGAGGGTVSVVQAYVSDTSRPQDRAKTLGWVTAATSAGVMIGPVIGSLAFQLGPAAPGLIAGSFCLANVAFAWRWLPESNPRDESRPAEARTPLRRSMRNVLSAPLSPVSTLIWVYAFGMFVFMSLNGVLVLYLERAFGFEESTVGYFYLYVATIALVMRALLLGPIVRRLGEPRTVKLGALTVAVGVLGLPWASGLPVLALIAMLVPVGTSLLFPTTTSLVSQRFSAREAGQAMGVQQAFGGVARLSGPIWATWAFQQLGVDAPFLLAGALMLVVTLFSLRIGPAPDSEAGGEGGGPVGGIAGESVTGEPVVAETGS